jgi:hypothetical protein
VDVWSITLVISPSISYAWNLYHFVPRSGLVWKRPHKLNWNRIIFSIQFMADHIKTTLTRIVNLLPVCRGKDTETSTHPFLHHALLSIIPTPPTITKSLPNQGWLSLAYLPISNPKPPLVLAIAPPVGDWRNPHRQCRWSLWRPRFLLTVKFHQPSHEFTFGVGMNFIYYILVLTPLV